MNPIKELQRIIDTLQADTHTNSRDDQGGDPDPRGESSSQKMAPSHQYHGSKGMDVLPPDPFEMEQEMMPLPPKGNYWKYPAPQKPSFWERFGRVWQAILIAGALIVILMTADKAFGHYVAMNCGAC